MVGKITAAMFFVPVKVLGIVETKLNIVLCTSVCKVFNYISAVGCCINNIVFVNLGMKKCKAVMMLCCNNKILHSAVLCKFNDFICIKINRIKSGCKFFVFSNRNCKVRTNPFCIIITEFALVFSTKKRIKTEMHHHSVACIFKKFNIVHSATSIS